MAPSVLVVLDVVLDILLVFEVEIIYELICLCNGLLPLTSSSLVTSHNFRGLFLAPVSGGNVNKRDKTYLMPHTL